MAAGVEILGFEGLDEPAQGGLVGLPELPVGRKRQISDDEHDEHQRQNHGKPGVGGAEQAPDEAHHEVGGQQLPQVGPGPHVTLVVDAPNGHGDERVVDQTVQEGGYCATACDPRPESGRGVVGSDHEALEHEGGQCGGNDQLPEVGHRLKPAPLTEIVGAERSQHGHRGDAQGGFARTEGHGSGQRHHHGRAHQHPVVDLDRPPVEEGKGGGESQP